MRKGLILSVVAVLAVLLMIGCAAKDEKVSHEGIKGKSIDIATGEWYEACDKWTPGDTVNITFSSSKPVGFNVHYHEKRSQEKIYAIEQTVTDSFAGSVKVQSDDVYCCMWQNDNSKYITLKYDMNIEKQ